MDSEFSHIVCLFCQTGQEERVVRKINELTDYQAIFPIKRSPYWEKGSWSTIDKPLFKSYVFVYSNEEIVPKTLHNIDHALRILKYSDDETDLYGPDRDMALWLWRQNGLVGLIGAVKDGERVVVEEGPLKNLNGKVVKVDKRKRLAEVQIDLVGNVTNVWLGLDFLKNTDQE